MVGCSMIRRDTQDMSVHSLPESSWFRGWHSKMIILLGGHVLSTSMIISGIVDPSSYPPLETIRVGSSLAIWPLWMHRGIDTSQAVDLFILFDTDQPLGRRDSAFSRGNTSHLLLTVGKQDSITIFRERPAT